MSDLLSNLSEQRKIASAIKRMERLNLSKALDPFRPESRPNPKQEAVLRDLGSIRYRYLIAGNQSGKSATPAREIAWILNQDHPYWSRPEEWANEPLLIIIAGQDLTMMGTELWGKKLKPFLDMNKWKEVRQGGVLKQIVNQETKDTIILVSHADGSDNNRKHMQGYTAHYVWLDEMPSNHIILEELQLRVQSKKGYFLATFTPKFRNDRIRKIIDGSTPPFAKVYRMSKFDNPIFADSREEEMARLAGFSEAERRTILYGDWSTGDSAVYRFDYDAMTVPSMPEYYSHGWKHVLSVDPAMKSKFGFTLWAEDPATGTWILIRDEYIEGLLAPSDIVIAVEERTKGYNIVRRICDPHEPWFRGEALKMFRHNYLIVEDKRDRKHDMIKNLQHKLSSGKIKIGSWCSTFLDEIQSCQWAENTDRIINASSYHTLDCSQYFCDLIPAFDPINVPTPWQVELRMKSNAQKAAKHSQSSIRKSGSRNIRGWGVGNFYSNSRHKRLSRQG